MKTTRSARGRRGNRKVLVVDDDRELTHLLSTALQRWGYIALQANNAAEAIRIARNETVDAALIDVRMPDADGLQLLQRLREDDEHLVAVIMTGYADLEGARRAMRLGAYDYLTKPFDITVLRPVLKAGLKENARTAARPQGAAGSSALSTTARR